LFCRKRYKKAEKEFLDAKLQLFERLERKELLTEHLCTIIEQNEIRKARKLSELMNRLQPGGFEGDFRMADGNVVSHVTLLGGKEGGFLLCRSNTEVAVQSGLATALFLTTGFSPQRPRLNLIVVFVGFLVNKVERGRFCSVHFGLH
jgi:hypothetical protein